MIYNRHLKQDILDGTISGFVSNNIEFNINETICFADSSRGIETGKGDDFKEDLIIAKAECVAIIKFASIDVSDHYGVRNILFFSEFTLRVRLLLESLGEPYELSTICEIYEYYKKLLGKELEGYLHVFKIII